MSEELARKFHDLYERRAPAFGYETREDTREFDPTTPNGKLMIAVTDEIECELNAELERLRLEKDHPYDSVTVQRIRDIIRDFIKRDVRTKSAYRKAMTEIWVMVKPGPYISANMKLESPGGSENG